MFHLYMTLNCKITQEMYCISPKTHQLVEAKTSSWCKIMTLLNMTVKKAWEEKVHFCSCNFEGIKINICTVTFVKFNNREAKTTETRGAEVLLRA